eukprot:jgi/Mesvir1/15237/Mv06462-RA.1
MQLIGSTAPSAVPSITQSQESDVPDTPGGVENQTGLPSDDVDSETLPNSFLPSDSSQGKRQGSSSAYYPANGSGNGSRSVASPTSARESPALVAAVSQILSKPSPSPNSLPPSSLPGDTPPPTSRGRADSRKSSNASSLATVTWAGDHPPPGTSTPNDPSTASIKPPIAGPGGSHWPQESLTGDRPAVLRHYRRSHAATQTDQRELVRVEELSVLVESMRVELDAAQKELTVMEDRMRAKQEDVVLARADVEKRVKAKLSYLEESHAKKIEQLRAAHRVELNDAVNAAECRAKAEQVRIYEAKLATATDQNADDKQRIAELEKELFLENSQMSAIKETVQQLEARVATQRSEIEQREAEVDNILLQKAKLSEKEFEIREMAKSIQRMEASFANQGQRNQTLTRQVQELEKELAHYRANEEAQREQLEQERANIMRGFTQGERHREEDQNLFRLRLEQMRGDFEREKAVHEILLQRQSRAYEKLVAENAQLRAQLAAQSSENASSMKRAQQEWDFERAALHKALAAANNFNASPPGGGGGGGGGGGNGTGRSSPRSAASTPRGMPGSLDPIPPHGKIGRVGGVPTGMSPQHGIAPSEADDTAAVDSRMSLSLMYALPSDHRVSIRALNPAEAMALHEASLNPLVPITVGRGGAPAGAVERALEEAAASGSINPGDVTFRGFNTRTSVNYSISNPGDVTFRSMPHLSVSQRNSVSNPLAGGGQVPRGDSPPLVASVQDLWRARRVEDGEEGTPGGATAGDPGRGRDQQDGRAERGREVAPDTATVVALPSWLDSTAGVGGREDPGAQPLPVKLRPPAEGQPDYRPGGLQLSRPPEGSGDPGGERDVGGQGAVQRRRMSDKGQMNGEVGADRVGEGATAGAHSLERGLPQAGAVGSKQGAGGWPLEPGRPESRTLGSTTSGGVAGNAVNSSPLVRLSELPQHVDAGDGSVTLRASRLASALTNGSRGSLTGAGLSLSGLDQGGGKPSTAPGSLSARDRGSGSKFGTSRRGKPVFDVAAARRAADGPSQAHLADRLENMAAMSELVGMYQGRLRLNLEEIAQQGAAAIATGLAHHRAAGGGVGVGVRVGGGGGGRGYSSRCVSGVSPQDALVASWRGGAQTSRGSSGNASLRGGTGESFYGTDSGSAYGDDCGGDGATRSAGGPRSKGRRVVENGYLGMGGSGSGPLGTHAGAGHAFPAPMPPGQDQGGFGLGANGPSWPEAVGPATHHNPWTAQYAGR